MSYPSQTSGWRVGDPTSTSTRSRTVGVAALNQTIRLMGEIDEVIDGHGGCPIK